jgi:quercetin dioxygenase-like cupin family protein
MSFSTATPGLASLSNKLNVFHLDYGQKQHTGNEIVYIQEGPVTFEAQGKPAVTLKPGEAFTTVDGEVHNVKNASSSAPAKALAFYVAKKGAGLEDLSVPAK